MAQGDRDAEASELTARIVTARVAAAAGRPTRAEALDTAQYHQVILDEVRRGLGLPPLLGDEEPG